MIDAFFQSDVVITESGRPRRANAFKVILHQLSLKEMAGSRKASKLLTRYINFAARQRSSDEIEVRVIPDPSDKKDDQ
jgi:hypothetical protein